MDERGARYHPRPDRSDFEIAIARHGLPPLGMDPAHIALIREEQPDVYAAAAAFVEPVDYLNARLTGRITATQTTAFPLLAVDNRVHDNVAYDDELIRIAGHDRAKLPELVHYDEVIGSVTPEAADHLGVTAAAVVVTGTIDSITSAIGTGALDRDRGAVIIGTTAVIVTHVDHKAEDLDHFIISVPSPVPGRYFVMAENGVGGKALEFFVRNVGLPGATPDGVEALAAASVPGANGVLFFPWLNGSLAPSPNWNVRAGFANLGLTTTRADLARSVYDGVALNAAWLLPHVVSFAGAEWASIRFGGGGATSDLWAQTLADATGREVEQLAGPQSTNARGAALLALQQLGHISFADIPTLVDVRRRFEPDHRHRALYDDLLASFTEFHVATAQWSARLHGRLPTP